MRRGGVALLVIAGVLAPAIVQAQSGMVFTDFTAAGGGSATGTLDGASLSLTGPAVSAPPASNVSGSSTAFSSSAFTPSLATSDAIEIQGLNGYAYTLSFGAPTANPVLHLKSLASRLDFPPGTSLTRVSGTAQFAVSGASVSGTLEDGDDDGTVRLNGTFTSIGFSATPLFSGGNVGDGILVQVGAPPRPVPTVTPTPTPSATATPADTTPPETTITFGPEDGDVVGDVPPTWQFTSSEPGSRFECRTYDPAAGTPPAFAACTAPHYRKDLIRKIALGERSVFEVRAIDAAGNTDGSPARRAYRKHGKLGDEPDKVRCESVVVARTSGGQIHSNCHLAPVRNGKVSCVGRDSLDTRRCGFTNRSGPYVVDKDGRRWAVSGELISAEGERGGNFVIAAPLTDDNKLSCAKLPRGARTSDTAGSPSSMPLSSACTPEKLLSSFNASGFPLRNVATKEVCIGDFPHPDGAELKRSPEPGVYCYTGEGAAVNDRRGRERDELNEYYGEARDCHIAVLNPSVTLIVAKRPATLNSPYRVNPKSKLVWRPVSPLTIANDER